MSLAMRLQKLRTQRGQSLQVVADAVGASKAHIWELEKGTTKNPSIELLKGLAEHFGVTIASLVGEDPSEAEDEQMVVMYRDLQKLDAKDRQFIEAMIETMKKRGSKKPMQIDRVELADCTSPERIIAEILRQIPDLPIPVPIEELATAVGITAIHRMTTDNFEGGLITQPERRDGVILVNGKANRLRQRYTIGHELGHYLIAAHQPRVSGQFTCSKSDMSIRKADRDDRAQRMEAEANRFSAGMLMPLLKFKADMRSQGGPDLNHVVELAARYDVSKEATAIHYSSYHHDPCAIILSQNGLVKRVYKSSRFPFVESSIGRPLPHNSLSASYQSSDAAWDQVDRGVWLASLERPSTIDEQALCLANGWKMTMLVHEESEDDSDGEVRDTYDVWENPRFPGKNRRR